jgi:hypothetical protein
MAVLDEAGATEPPPAAAALVVGDPGDVAPPDPLPLPLPLLLHAVAIIAGTISAKLIFATRPAEGLVKVIITCSVQRKDAVRESLCGADRLTY